MNAKRLENIYQQEQTIRQQLRQLKIERIKTMRALKDDGMSYAAIGKCYGGKSKQYILSQIPPEKKDTYQPE